MKDFFNRIISISIIAFIVFINWRTLVAYIKWAIDSYSWNSHYDSKITLLNLWKKSESWSIHDISPCRKTETVELSWSTNKIIVRIDDINEDTSTDILKTIVTESQKLWVPLVLSVVSDGLEKNHDLMQFLKSESCNVEIAIHGWDHFFAESTTWEKKITTEFSDISFEDALDRLAKAKQVLSSLTDEPIITFTPPYNIISTWGILALKKSWIHVLSSIWSGVFDAHQENTLEKKKTFSKEEVLQNCKFSLDKDNVCIILLDIDTFLSRETHQLDPVWYREYLSVIEYFSKNGAQYTTFRQLEKEWPDFSKYSLLN